MGGTALSGSAIQGAYVELTPRSRALRASAWLVLLLGVGLVALDAWLVYAVLVRDPAGEVALFGWPGFLLFTVAFLGTGRAAVRGRPWGYLLGSIFLALLGLDVLATVPSLIASFGSTGGLLYALTVAAVGVAFVGAAIVLFRALRRRNA